MNLGKCFTYLYVPALRDVCPTFLLFHCEQMHVLTPPISLQEQFPDLDEAAQLVQGLQLAGTSEGSSYLPLLWPQVTQRSFRTVLPTANVVI